ncbi:RND family transporter [candidate division KSB1 bacterium]|nr:RND family transporter [candidate division KSB1 bacterium]
MKKFADLVIRFRIPIIVTTMLVTAFFSYSLKDLKINSDILSYMPQDDPIVILFNEVGQKFGGNSLAMVALETDDVFNYKTLNRVNTIIERFKRLDEVSHVMGLTDILDIKKTEWGLEISKLIDKHNIPQTPEELKSLREYTLSKNMYRGSLVSADGEVTLVIARLREEVDKIAIGRQLKKIIAETPGDEKIYYGGLPFQMVFLIDLIMANLKKFLPLVSLLVMASLYFSFKSFRGVFLPLITVFISSVWAMGVMSLMNISLTMASQVVPVLLIAIGSAYGIHMVAKYNEDVRRGDTKIEGIKHALSEVGVPILLAGVTTLIGFLSFLSSDLNVIREFGASTALGVTVAMIMSVTFLPAVLSFLKVKKVKVDHRGIEDNWATRFMDRLGGFVLKREKLILVLGAVVILISLVAIPKLDREVDYASYFEKDSEIRQAEELLEQKLGGAIPIQLFVKGDIKNPFVLKEMLRFEKYLESLPNINDPQSIADLICEMNWVMNGHRTIPDTREGVANLWFFIEGNEVLDQLINSEATEGLIQAKMGSVNTKKAIAAVDAVEDYLRQHLKTNLVEARISQAEGELAGRLKKERVAGIVSKMKWDIRKRAVNEQIPDANLEKVITAAVLADHERFDEATIKIIKQKISDYFLSDEADVQIESEKVIERIVNNIGKLLQTSRPDEEAISTILKWNVSKEVYADDPVVLEYAAESIVAVINEQAKWARVNHLLEDLKPLLSRKLTNNTEFLEDLRDDVWEINEDWIVVESSQYASLFSAQDNPGKAEVKLAAWQTGLPLIYKELDRKIMRSQSLGLGLAIFLVFVLLAIRLKSLVGGLMSVFPIILAILINFILMVILDIPLDELTILMGNIAMGVGIDYAIHFITRFKVEFAKSKSELEALDRTLETTGKAIMINAVTVMMGFLVLVTGDIVPMKWFGYLMALTMMTSAFSAVTILPALILITKAKCIGDFSGFATAVAGGTDAVIGRAKARIKKLKNRNS